MALQTTNWNYIRIAKEDVIAQLSNIKYNVYKNETTRQSPTEFDQAPWKNNNISPDTDLVNLVITAQYLWLKTLPEFENALDV